MLGELRRLLQGSGLVLYASTACLFENVGQ
jgi:hypothetical protein